MRSVLDWKCWYVRRGGYWATVKVVDGCAIGDAYATYHYEELLHYITGVEGGYDNSPSPSIIPANLIEIPLTFS